jgi:signal peptidase I
MSELTQPRRARTGFFGTALSIAEALLIAAVIRTLLFQPFDIPSGSMEPTLLVGDYLFVSKYSYGYSHYSIPFSPPLFSGRIFAFHRPQRGDVVVFRLPSDTSVDYIKRVIGLPGDRIQLINGVVHINGVAVERQRVGDFVGRNPCGPSADGAADVRVPQWRETLPNGVSYNTLNCRSFSGFPDNTDVYTIPPDHYFMMGDNRENSEDSRFPEVGYVPFENMIGPAQIIFFSLADETPAWAVWSWPWEVRWSRLFTIVR